MRLQFAVAAAMTAALCCALARSACAQHVSSESLSAEIASAWRLSLASHVNLFDFDIEKDGDGHSHAHPIGEPDQHDFTRLPAPLGANLFEGWFDKWSHTHYSRQGTPFVHLFANEPAFMDRDFFLDFALTNGEEGMEFELEAEIEYTFTRRIGLVIEAPYAWLDPDDETSENGFGDIAVAPRFLLLDYDRFLLAVNMEFEFPTGNEDRGLGAGETIFAPSISTWLDLGNDFTLQNNVGIEHGLSSDSDAFVWGGALTYSIYTKGEPEIIRSDGAVRAHFPEGLLNLIAEIRGEHPLDGEDEGNGTAEWILGASYSLSPHVEVRAALTFPAWNPREFDNGAIFSLIYHF